MLDSNSAQKECIFNGYDMESKRKRSLFRWILRRLAFNLKLTAMSEIHSANE